MEEGAEKKFAKKVKVTPYMIGKDIEIVDALSDIANRYWELSSTSLDRDYWKNVVLECDKIKLMLLDLENQLISMYPEVVFGKKQIKSTLRKKYLDIKGKIDRLKGKIEKKLKNLS